MPTLETRAGTINYTENGVGPPLVLLHATLHDHHDYDAVIEPLAHRHRVIAVDWPHHGDVAVSGPPPDAIACTDALADLVDPLELRGMVLVGNSVGGFAATTLALDRPDAVAGLVLVNTGGLSGTNPMTRAWCRNLGRPAVARRIVPRLVPAYMRCQSELDRQIADRARCRARTPDGAAVAATLWRSFATPEYDLRSRAAGITTPTLVAWGTRDLILPRRAGRATHRAIPHAEYHEFATGHVPFASQPT